jgi:ribonuclease P/MRP protein subunit RPP40
VISGLPQGFVLGPLLFVIYLNDLIDGKKNSCKMYADDTKIISVIKTQNDSEALQSDLNLLLEWSDKWLLKFNIDKCKIMHVGKKNLKKIILWMRRVY